MRLRRSDLGRAQVTAELRMAYDAAAAVRDQRVTADWKVDERAAFLDRLHVVQARTLLEIGAGPGHDSAYFAAEGLDVTAVDLSPAMVARTRDKGVPAYVRDVLDLGFPADSFDAVYAFNVLLHVPNADLDDALRGIRTVLKPGGLFFLGVFGGQSQEGIFVDDEHVPARFFALRSDQELLSYAGKQFDVVDFHVYDDGKRRFQSLTLVRPTDLR